MNKVKNKIKTKLKDLHMRCMAETNQSDTIIPDKPNILICKLILNLYLYLNYRAGVYMQLL